tara:strand:+ start:756 stop:1349 length:594 start_codon:yes stop_codon:yes gene_type:complete
MNTIKNINVVNIKQDEGLEVDFKRIRKSLGYTQQYVADKINKTVLSYNLIENRKLSPNQITLARINKVFGINQNLNQPAAHILNQIIICKDIFFHPNEGIEDDSINLVVAFRELCFDYYKLLNNEDFIERERKKFELQLSLSSLIKKLNLNKIRYSSYLDDLSKRLNISITTYSNNDRATIYQIDENNEPIYTDHDI